MSQLQAVVQPRHLGRYTLIERLGIGGQSEVWRVSDETADVDLALKILSPSAARSPQAWAALEYEYAVSTLLRHRGILRVLPPERIERCVVLPMELADGGNLSQLRGRGYLEIVPVLLEVTNALGYAHARGVVHRDLKPDNILFDRSGCAKLADFGVAAVLPGSGADETVTRAWGGSPFTSSPGQLRGEPASPADDVYGFGAMTYELLAGRPPYFPNFDAQQIQNGPVPQLVPARQAPVQLIELVTRMLAKNIEERPTSMHQIAEELEMTLNATLALDLTELADLSTGPASVSAPVTLGRAARARGLVGGYVEPRDTAAAAPSPAPAAAAPSPAPAVAVPSAIACPPEPVLASARTEPVLTREAVNPFMDIDEVPPLHGMYPPGSGGRYGAGGRHRAGPRRLRYLVIGVMFGVGAAVGAPQWLASQPAVGHLRQMFAAAVSAVQGGQSGPAAGPAAPEIEAETAHGGAAPVPSVQAGSPEELAPTVQWQRRMDSLAARGAARWGSADFAAAKQQVAEAQRAQQARDPSLAALHWRKANGLLLALERRVPLALAAELKAGQNALAAGRIDSAARAFALARRIDADSHVAATGLLRVRALRAVLPLLGAGRRAERAGDYSRAMYYYRQVLAREPHYAPVEVDLQRAREAFGTMGYRRSVRAGLDALDNGRLYVAQAAFQQALVYRPQGIKAATALSEVDAVLRHRAWRSHGLNPNLLDGEQ